MRGAIVKKRYVWYEDLDNIICCPGCGHQVDNIAEQVLDGYEFIEPNFCPDCGQALDWSETRSYGVQEEHETEVKHPIRETGPYGAELKKYLEQNN